MATHTVEQNESLSIALVRSIAASTNRDVSSLPPLHESIDPAALERLFEPTTAGLRAGTVEFRYVGYHVRISRTPDLTITLLEPSSTSENETASE